MAKSKKKSEGFEEGLELLEKLADELESGELKLEEAIRKYEEGVKLYAKCQEILNRAAHKVEMLTRNADGKLKAVPFDRDDAAAVADEDSGQDDEDSGGADGEDGTSGTDLF